MGKFFGRHYGTERFFVLIFAFFALICFFTGYSIHLRRIDHITTLTGTPVYTEEYMWSRTGEEGKVVDIRSNSDKTKVFVMLKNGISSSTNAEDYTVYMKGLEEPLRNNPQCTMYSYGNTGYFGLVFADTRGFYNQIYSVIIRNDSAASIVADSSMFDPNIENDESFYNHNQIRLLLNLGASNMEVLDVLNEEVLSPTNVYADILMAKDYEGYVDKMNDDMESMRDAYADIIMYRDRLKYNVIVPDLPYYIGSDTITVAASDPAEPVIFDPAMCYDMSDTIGSDYGSGEVGADRVTDLELETIDESNARTYVETGTDNEEIVHNYYFLHTDYLFPGGAVFDWQGRNLSYGFINQVYADGLKIPDQQALSYFEQHKAFRDKYKASEYTSLMPDHITYNGWRYLDGTYVELTGSADTQDGPQDYASSISTDINNYTAALNRYLMVKSAYYDDLYNVLELEYRAKSVNKMMTTNMDPKKFFTY